MQLDPLKLDATNTRIDLDIQDRMIDIESIYLNKNYASADIDGIYCIYNSETDNVTIHVPYSVALSLLLS